LLALFTKQCYDNKNGLIWRKERLIMVVSVRSLGLFGITGYEVSVECDVSGGMPGFDIVGLPDAAVREARERVRSAVRSGGYKFPVGRVTVNLAPAGRRKEGTVYDLPILMGILLSTGQLQFDLSYGAFLGEVSLSGVLRPVRGLLPMAIAAQQAGIRDLYVPEQNAREAALVEGLTVYPVRDLQQLVGHLTGQVPITPIAGAFPPIVRDYALDFADVKGQETVKRVLEIAAAGSHHVLMIGPPGSGKSMMAKRLPSILPDMTREEALESTQLWSVCGLLEEDAPLLTQRPFRSPHHTISAAALAGGGSVPRPGEVSLAHNGVLFLDEAAEFSSNALEVLRQPLEDGTVQISRVSGSMSFPSRFMLVCAMNPCKCGWYGHPERNCTCSPTERQRYLRRLSGPLLDRIDLKVYVRDLSFSDLSQTHPSESSEAIRERVNRARAIQQQRLAPLGLTCNAQMTGQALREYCRLDREATDLMHKAFDTYHLTARSYDRLLRVTRTIADLDGAEEISMLHLAEALQYRTADHLA
jgi:magnesium chelatase family protein